MGRDCRLPRFMAPFAALFGTLHGVSGETRRLRCQIAGSDQCQIIWQITTQSPDVDLDENDTAESLELPGADLSGEELTMLVVPKRADEFTCTCCFLVQHRSRIASHPGRPPVCTDCA